MISEMLAGVGALALGAVSARWNWWRPRATGVPILMYHKVGQAPKGSRLKKLWVSEDQFRWQMESLRRWGYEPITLREAADRYLSIAKDKGASDLSPQRLRPVVITFDDGYLNNVEKAWPILRGYGFPATLFVVVDAVGRDNFWHDPRNEIRLPMVSWSDLRNLRDAGWDVGSHTLSHPRLSRLSEDNLSRELEESRDRLAQELGLAPVSFAHPYGDGADDGRVRQAIETAGYRTACSVHRGLADFSADRFCLRRIFVRGDDTRWDFRLQLTRGISRL